MLRRITNVITGITFGTFPTAIVGLIGLAIYQAAPNAAGITIISILEVGALYLGYRIFRKIQFVGPIEFLSVFVATPELDMPEADDESDHLKRSSAEYADLVSRSGHLCKGGTLRLYGDWFGKPYRNPLTIARVRYDEQSDTLTFRFTGGEKLTINKPKHLYETGAYFKVLQAESVEMSQFSSKLNKSRMVLTYLKFWPEGRRVKSLTSAPEKRIGFDLSLSAPALMIYGDPNNLAGVGLETTTYTDMNYPAGREYEDNGL